MSSIFLYLFIFYLDHEYLDDSILHPIKQGFCIVFCLYTTQAGLWKCFRLQKHLLWCDSARRHWTISLPGTLWVCTGSLGMPGYEEMKSLTGSQGTVLFRSLWDQSLSGGVSRQNIRRKIKCWMENQHLVMWHGPCSTKRQAWELISRPNFSTRAQ